MQLLTLLFSPLFISSHFSLSLDDDGVNNVILSFASLLLSLILLHDACRPHVVGRRLLQLYEALEGWKSVCGRAYYLKGIKWKFSYSFTYLLLISGMMMLRVNSTVVGRGGGQFSNKKEKKIK